MFSPTRKEGGSLFQFEEIAPKSGKPMIREPIFFPETKGEVSMKKLNIELSSSVPPNASKILK